MTRRRFFSSLLLPAMLIITIWTACRQGNTLPDSSGHPYEVLIAGDGSSLLDSLLSLPMPGLPHNEPLMEVSMTKGKGLDGVERLARNIVEVDINLRKYKTTTLQNRQNVYAMPQTIVRITAPSVAHLRQFLSASGSRLIGFLVRTELSRAQGLLERNHNKEAILKMKRMFGMSMLVPSDMTASKQSRDFLWLSNNASTGMASFCLYYVYKGKEFRQQRDSVMRRNIPGEKSGMYMMTAVVARREVNPGRSTTIRGLWEMRNDDMGGPFIAYLPERLARGNRQLVAETFLFAPESRKRNLLRRMEAALYTIHQ